MRALLKIGIIAFLIASSVGIFDWGVRHFPVLATLQASGTQVYPGGGGASGPAVSPSSSTFTAATNCNGNTNCVQWVDNDSTDNCGTATTAWLTSINAYSGPGRPQVFITGGGNGKAFKFATASCTLAFTNTTSGVSLHISANIDCAQAAQACIQLGPTNTSGGAVSYTGAYYTIDGGGQITGGGSLTGSGGNGSGVGGGIYIMPQVNSFTITSIAMPGFGVNASMGSCSVASIVIDQPVGSGFITNSDIGVSGANTGTSGSCGILNSGGTIGQNTIVIAHNTVASNGFVGGSGDCGSVGIRDGGWYGEVLGNNVYGFGVPVQLNGSGHSIISNEIDSANCSATVNAAIQYGVSGSSAAVGPANLQSNRLQVEGGHTTYFVAQSSGSTATIQGWSITNNMNVTNPLGAGTNTIFNVNTNCTAGINYPYLCFAYGNSGFIPPSSCGTANTGWVVGSQYAACQFTATANIPASTDAVFTAPSFSGISNSIPVYITVNVILTSVGTTSTLPQAVLTWTDNETNSTQSVTETPVWASGTVGCSGSTTNTVGNSCASTGAWLNVKTGTTVYLSTTGYASTGTAMGYAVNVAAFLSNN